MRRLNLATCAVLALLASAAAVNAATRYDPRLRFRTISTPRFDIHFHQGEEPLARRLARIVEEAAAEVDASLGAPSGRVQVILVAQHDLSNGWATPLPYNTIEITAAAPGAEEIIGNTDDWLRLVFIHEYTHIAHLSQAAGWIGGLRRVFGRVPLLFPNLYQPLWAIEGLATWEETRVTGQGRVAAGDFRLLIEEASVSGRFEPLDRANGGNVDWPSGITPYLYGAYFHRMLAERYGRESLKTLTADTSRRLPYLGSGAYKKVFGRSLGELWNEYRLVTERDAATRAVTGGEAVRLTRHGFIVGGPRYAPDGRIFYSVSNPHGFPALMELRPEAAPRRITDRYLGNRIAIADGRLIVDEIDLIRSVGLQSDLYVVDPRDGRRQRLTHEARAMDPDVSPDGGQVAAVVQMSDRRALAIFARLQDGTLAPPDIVVSEAATEYSSPRWSPDGRLIAAERRTLGGTAEIAVIDPQDRSVRVVASIAGGRSASPVWTRDGQHLLFSAAVGQEPFRLHRVSLTTGAIDRLEGTGASAQSPDISHDGRTVVFVGYTADGYDLFSMSLDGAKWTLVATGAHRLVDMRSAADAADSSGVPGERPYSPWDTLVPRFWTPTIESDAGELVAGAATGSADALGRHAYAVGVEWSTGGYPKWRAAYTYDRWRPTLFASISDDTDPWRGGDLRIREGNAGLIFRVARVRASHATYAALHAAQESITCAHCEPAGAERHRNVSVRLGWEFSNARAFGYSISAEEGGRIAITTELSREALGSDGDGVALTLDARRYWRARPRHAVVAARLAAAGSWGDDAAARIFSASGNGPQPGGFGFGRGAVGLLRGFGDDDLAGTRAVVVNLDYRAPLARIDRGVGTWPVFVRAIHGSLFVDAGHAWSDTGRWRDASASAGAELSADTVVGFALPVTVTAGGAWRRDGTSGDRGFAFFARIGRAF